MRRTVLALLLLFAHAAAAQNIRGIVRDSTSHLAVGGTIVLVMDSLRMPLARTITNARGEYDLPRAPNAHTLRTLRLGFRPTEKRITPSASPTIQVDLDIAAVPVTLDVVRTIAAAQCPKRRDAQAALSLLEQVRNGLLATVVAREAKPAILTRLAVIRTRNFETDSVMAMTVYMDSAQSTNSYQAALTANDFIATGFARDSGGLLTAYGPDAEVLLDAAFANAYCFRLMEPTSSRPRQIGLGFTPAAISTRRTDIDGALWVDTSAKALVDIEFRYLGFHKALERSRPGGYVQFRAMPNGVTLIDRWALRIPSQDTRDVVEPKETRIRGFRPTRIVTREIGGELARARWEDGTAWRASLGTVQLHLAEQGGLPDTNRYVMLDSTSFLGRSDSAGNVAFSELPPGPYDVALIDIRLAKIGILIPTRGHFTAVRDSTVQLTVTTQTPDEFIRRQCAADKTPSGSAILVGRILEGDDTPAKLVNVTIDHLDYFGTQRVAEGGQTGSDGTFRWCGLERGMSLLITVERGEAKRVVEVKDIASLTVLQFTLRADP